MKSLLSLLFGLLLVLGPASAQELAPDAMVRQVTEDVLTVVRQDKDIQSGNTRKAIDLVETKVLPYFNFQRMTALAVGRRLEARRRRNRRSACPRSSRPCSCAPTRTR
jgi:phospholipid transport system substrate-binding protein